MTNRNRTEPKRNLCTVERHEAQPSRRAALITLGAVVYAVRLNDGCIKIGSTTNLYQRIASLGTSNASAVELLAFTPGRLFEEALIHDALGNSLARGREYYHPTQEVLDVVNEMRGSLGLTSIAA